MVAASFLSRSAPGKEWWRHILADGRIDAEETAWLRRMLLAEGTMDDEERKFLHELNGEAQHVSPEFKILFQESIPLVH